MVETDSQDLNKTLFISRIDYLLTDHKMTFWDETL